METVPVTLGAVLPGITGVPPLFGKAAESNKTAGLAAGIFLQELQSMVAESYGGPKPLNKADAPVKKEPAPVNEEKATHTFGFVPVTVSIQPTPPLVVSVPAAQLLNNVVNTKADATQHAIPPQPVEVEAKLSEVSIPTTKPEISITKPALPVASLPSWLKLVAKDQVKGRTQVQEPNASAPAPPVNTNEEVKAPGLVLPQEVRQEAPSPIQPPNEKPVEASPAVGKLQFPQEAASPIRSPNKKSVEASAAVGKPPSPLVEKIVRSTKGAGLTETRGKTVGNQPAAPTEVRALETPVSNIVVVPALPDVPNEKPSQKSANIPPTESRRLDIQPVPVVAPIEVTTAIKPEGKTHKVGDAKLKTQDPKVQPVQKQDNPLPKESVELPDVVQSFNFGIGEVLNASVATQLVPHPQESKLAPQIASEPLRAKASASIPDAPPAAAKLPADVPAQLKIPSIYGDNIEVPALHKSAVPQAKPLVSDRSAGHDVQLEIKSSRAETKPADSAQKANANANDHETAGAVAASTPRPTHPVPQVEPVSASDRDTSALPQIVLPPSAHAPASTPSSTGRSEAPGAAAPAEAPVLPSLPSDGLQTARLVDRLGQAEMHLGMHTESFGSVQVHTVIRDSQVGLTIGSERGDLKTYLAAEVSGLESNLRQHDLHFNDVRFVGSSFSPGGNQYGGAGSQSQSFQQGRSFPHVATGFALGSERENETEIVTDETSGLSVHA